MQKLIKLFILQKIANVFKILFSTAAFLLFFFFLTRQVKVYFCRRTDLMNVKQIWRPRRQHRSKLFSSQAFLIIYLAVILFD